MKVLICLTLILSLVCVSQANFLQKELMNYLTETIDIPAGQTVSTSNPLPFQITTKCQIQTASPNAIQICNNAVNGTISINGLALTKQQCYNNINGETFTLLMSGSATLKLTNNGNYDVKSVCTVSLLEEAMSFFQVTTDIPAGATVNNSNPFPMAVKASCTIQTQSPTPIKIYNTPLAGTISINGAALTSAGQCFENTNGETFTLSMTGSANLQLKNEGNYDVKSVCTLLNLLEQK